MKVKIEKVLKAHDPYRGTSKTSGKPYCIYAYDCKGYIDGTASDFFSVKTMSEPTANLLQAGGEFDAEASTYKNETSYMVKGAFAGSAGGWKGGASKYTPRVYLSGKQFFDMMRWCKKIADELYPQASVQAFDKIAGCASVMLDLSKYAAPKQEAQPIRAATAADVQPATGADPHAGLTDEVPDAGIPAEDVPF